MLFVSDSLRKILNNEALMGVAASKKAVTTDASFGCIYAGKAGDSDPRAEIQYSDSEINAQRAKNNALNKIKDYDLMSVLRVGTEAPEEVKMAWIEASREVGRNGLGKTADHGFRGLLAGQLGCNHSNSVDGTVHEMSATYSAESTPQNPIVEVKLKYGDQEKMYKVNINDVDMNSGSQVEQFALISYAGDTEGIVHKYPAKEANVPNVLYKPNLYSMLSKYGLTQIPWEKNYMGLDIFSIWKMRNENLYKGRNLL